MKTYPNRKHPRMNQYDYSSPGAYYITICTHNKEYTLSEIVKPKDGTAVAKHTELGKIVSEQFRLLEKRYPHLHIDQFVVMPNHIHAIMFLAQYEAEPIQRASVIDMICAFKSLAAREGKRIYNKEKIFQASFYDHLIRNETEYRKIAEYIQQNPLAWELEKFCPLDF